METRESVLTKSQLAESVISILSINTLGYTFLKSNNRAYYFVREDHNPIVIDMMVITVYFRRGLITCELQSRLDTKKHSGTLRGGINTNAYLINTRHEWKKKQNIFEDPKCFHYCFKQSTDSLNETLRFLLADLEVQGAILLKTFDARLNHPKFLCAVEFIRQYEPAKRLLREVLRYNLIADRIPNWTLYTKEIEKHQIFEYLLEELLNRLKKIKEKMVSMDYDPHKPRRAREVTDRMLAFEAVYHILFSDLKNVFYWSSGWHYV
ncbi:hypothetical protein [Emticicia agri]|nr:hypothetical protein [Emticicia agri]